jgi:hypothetical protein
MADDKRRSRDTAGRFLPGHPVGADTRWRHISGNPAGVPRARKAFETAFYAALLGEGTPEEAATLLWKAARDHEPWAIQALLQRLAPQEARLKVTHEGTSHGQYDLSKLSDSELEQFIQLAARARGAGENELEAGCTIDAVAELPAGGEGETQVP